LSQVANTFWDDRLERVAAAKERAVVKRRVRSRRLIDAVIIAIILAASATCISVYSRARAELDGALTKHAAAGEKLSNLTLKVQKLERDVQQLRTDPRVIELFARQRFGFIRSGDVVIKIQQEPTDTTRASRESDIVKAARESDTARAIRDSGAARVILEPDTTKASGASDAAKASRTSDSGINTN
jgi:cell division protein FtsB